MIRTLALAAAAAIGLGSAAGAAPFYDFRTPGSSGTANSLDYGLFSVTSGASFLGFDRPSDVSYGDNGLGVAAFLDLHDPAQIDGFPVGTREWLTVSFDYAVRLVNFTVGLMDSGDEYLYSINGGPLVQSGLAFNAVDVNHVHTFSIFAVGQGRDELYGQGVDDFTLKALQVAAVPVPAAGLLLLGGLGVLGAVRRSRRAA